jgi:PAS domain S-box-containing protein
MTSPTKALAEISSESPLADQLRLALAAAEFGDWSWDPQTDRINMSPHASRTFGLSPETETCWRELWDLLHAEDRKKARQALENALFHQALYDTECRIISPRGELRWVSVKGRALYSQEGMVTGMVGLVHDITERKLMEEEQQRLALELQNRLNEWQSLFDTAPIAIWLAHDPECKRVTGNHYTNSILGVANGRNISVTSSAPQKVSFQIWQDGRAIGPDEFPLRIACFRGIPVRNCEQEVRTPDGRRVSVLVNAVPLFDENKQIRGALATGLDITERKKTEFALRESEQRFRLMADASPALIWIVGPDKLCSWVNKAWLSFVGKPLESQLGMGWTENIHPEDVKYCLESFLHSFDSRHDFELEYRLRRADGQHRWLLSKGRPFLGMDGQFAGFIGSCVDVTESKLRREELELLVAERTSQMKESIAHLEAFSYTVSHDMRAPLRSMEGFSSALLEDYGDRLDEIGRDYLKRVIKSAQKLDLLIEHVLSYSRIATGKLALSEVDLSRVLEDVLAENAQMAPEARVFVELEERVVRAHEQMLQQIFSNLLLNAAKFVPRGTQPEIRVKSEPIGGMVRVIVQDNGIGIEDAHRERIFEVFSKLHPEHEYAGTGIGLAIVKKAVQMLGGEIGVDSEVGKGSRFWFTLKR